MTPRRDMTARGWDALWTSVNGAPVAFLANAALGPLAGDGQGRDRARVRKFLGCVQGYDVGDGEQ